MGSPHPSRSRRNIKPLLHGRAREAAVEPGDDILIVALDQVDPIRESTRPAKSRPLAGRGGPNYPA